jgi:HlyD family type I secretion membrane fusion protein
MSATPSSSRALAAPIEGTAIDLGIRPEPVEADIPMSTRGPILAGLFLIFGLLGGATAWAIVTPIASAVVAHGTVVVESHRRDIQHLDGGLVAAVYVREGDAVTAGQTLISLDPTRVRANLEVLRNQELALLASLARLRAEQLGRDELVMSDTVAGQLRGDARGRDALESQQALFRARRDAHEGQIAILRQRIAQLRAQIEGFTLQRQAAARQAALIEEEIAGISRLERQGFAPRNRILAMERELARYRGDEAEHIGNIARSEQAIGEAELQIIQATRTRVEEASRQLLETENQIRETRERLVALEDQISRLEIVAPISGRIVGLQVTNAGAVIQPGRTIMSIVPEDDELVIEAAVETHQIESVIEGAEVVIHFTALPQRTLPMLTGRVRMVGADQIVHERTGMPFYRVLITVDEASRAKIADRRLLPGMPADVVIATGGRTVMSYLLNPLAPLWMRMFRER